MRKGRSLVSRPLQGTCTRPIQPQLCYCRARLSSLSARESMSERIDSLSAKSRQFVRAVKSGFWKRCPFLCSMLHVKLCKPKRLGLRTYSSVVYRFDGRRDVHRPLRLLHDRCQLQPYWKRRKLGTRGLGLWWCSLQLGSSHSE
jgi:hypothetical protein